MYTIPSFAESGTLQEGHGVTLLSVTQLHVEEIYYKSSAWAAQVSREEGYFPAYKLACGHGVRH